MRVIVLVAAIAVWLGYNQGWVSHITTSLGAIQKLRQIPDKEIDAFFVAYDKMHDSWCNREGEGDSGCTGEECLWVRDYYRVLHEVLSVGVMMEVMLMPPTIDDKASVLHNIYLWERRMHRILELKPGMTVVEVGSGRGKISANFAIYEGANAIQINIDPSQVAFAKGWAEKNGVLDKMKWNIQDYNEMPYSFIPDESVDAVVCTQSCGFLNNRSKFMKEVNRILKPGRKFYSLEYLATPKYDPKNKEHRKILCNAASVTGAPFPTPVKVWEDAFKEVNFDVKISHDFSSKEMVNWINERYGPMKPLTQYLSSLGFFSKRFQELFDRLNYFFEDGLVPAYEQNILSLTWEFVAVKPMSATAQASKTIAA